jgi:isoleucyl-tRNA synthetase
MPEEQKQTINEQEKSILEFWKRNKIYEKSKKANLGNKKFYMMDGPPYATGSIHIGTALNKILKDISMRVHRLQGFDVFDRAGYDTHGVPIEFKVEKEIGSKSKKDIESFGIKKFVNRCKEFATKYIDLMNSEFENLGVWMNFLDPYLTLSNDYIEKIWETFKVADEKGLLYLGKYPVHICPRCETAVAFNEIEYSKQEDTSVFVKFPLKNKKNTFLIIWTTTPWTLPANTGVMVHPEFIYQQIELSNGENWIIAKELVPKIMSKLELGYTIKKEFHGKLMENWEYKNPLSKNLNLKIKNAYRVILTARYVNLEDGTGLVHSAPGHGKEDYEVGKEYNLDMPSPVLLNGLLTEETGKYQGKQARIVDEEIIQDLENDKAIVTKVKYSHDYPLCWRCRSPLLMVAQPQWFLRISDIQAKLLQENEKIYWIPGWMKLRMKAWLEGLSDWPVSRMRYWGTPLPIWVCDKCQRKVVIGSISELEKISKKKIKEIHKPDIDKIQLPCSCRGIMKRVPEVLDVWFDSGVSSWASLNDKEFKKFWPADLNLEGKDQVRGWWNSQLILSQIRFGRKPMDAILEHGMVLDLGKKKMAKSLGNIVSPQEVIDKYSRDYLRYYFAKTSKGEDFSFDENEFKEIEKFFRVFLNLNNFVDQLGELKEKVEIEDKWIISKLNNFIKESTQFYNSYQYPEVVQLIENFVVNDFSKTYIQLIRERSGEASNTLRKVRLDILKIIAAICPFITENIWQELRKNKAVNEESIHLSAWPKFDEKKIDKKLEEEFSNALKIIEIGLKERDIAQIGLKWPLKSADISANFDLNNELKEIIARQLNIKGINFEKVKEVTMISIKLDTKLTPELEAEGYARELSRKVQALRKDNGLIKENEIDLLIITSDKLKRFLEKQKEFIKERTNSRKISVETKKQARIFQASSEDKIKEEKIEICFDKI